MSITVYGVDPSIDELHWARLLQDLGDLRAGSGISAGLTASVATGTRLVKVTSGRSIQGGTLAESNADQNIALDANTDSQPRIDTICMQVDWSKTAAAGGTLVAVKGVPAASPVAPALQRDPGSLFQTPIRDVLVRAGVGQLLDSDLGRSYGTSAAAPGWVTFAPTPAAGWTIQTARYQFVGALVYLELRATRTGAPLVADSGGNLDDTAVLGAGGLPTAIRPKADQPLRFSRLFFQSGTALARASGALTLTDAYPTSTVPTNGVNVVISDLYPVD